MSINISNLRRKTLCLSAY